MNYSTYTFPCEDRNPVSTWEYIPNQVHFTLSFWCFSGESTSCEDHPLILHGSCFRPSVVLPVGEVPRRDENACKEYTSTYILLHGNSIRPITARWAYPADRVVFEQQKKIPKNKAAEGQNAQTNFTIFALGTNTINATGAANSTTLNAPNTLNNIEVGVEVRQEETRANPTTTKRKATVTEVDNEPEYAPWPSTPPFFTAQRKRKKPRQTTGSTPYTAAELAELRSFHPLEPSPPSSPSELPLRQRMILLQHKLTQLNSERELQLGRLKHQYVRFQEADRRMGRLVAEVQEELGRLIECGEVREGDWELTSRDETDVEE